MCTSAQNKITYYGDLRIATDFAADSGCSSSQFIVGYMLLMHFQDYEAGVLCQESRQVSVFLYLIGNTELDQCYLCVICIVGGDSLEWHYFSAWDAVILAQIRISAPGLCLTSS